MIISKTIFTKWNSRTKKYYESLGYQYTKMKDVFEVKVEHIKTSSQEKVLIECDYCKKHFWVIYHHFINCRKDSCIKKDSCTSCKHLKAAEVVFKKYGVSNIIDINGIKDKRDNSIIEKYGVKNVFQSEEIKSIIRKQNLEKYGSESFTQTNLYNQKRKKTCLQKYGEESHMKTEKYKSMFSGENSPRWKGGIQNERWERLQPKYREWRQKVFFNNDYMCQKCKIKKTYIVAHHIFNWKDNPDYRYDVNNGITFCRDCHENFHKKYGKKNNNKNQLIEFLQT